MNISYKKIVMGFAVSIAIPAAAQNVLCKFETADYDSIKVYDSWKESPFNKGTLQGNIAVVDNPMKDDLNPSNKVLAVQRSRFGSNLFGAKVRLKSPFDLTTTTQYIHVLLNKPIRGKVMLIGLGKRTDRIGQSDQVEQFNVLSSTSDVANGWYDAVFAVKGNGGIKVSSLVLVPECASRDANAEDFVAYIDSIEINSKPSSRTIFVDYPVNVNDGATHKRTERVLTSLYLTGSNGKRQEIVTNNVTSPISLLKTINNEAFVAKAGETLIPQFNYSATWMSGYVYVDFERNGKFSSSVVANKPAVGSDLVSYSAYNENDAKNAYNSAGENFNLTVTEVDKNNSRIFKPLPSFSLPSDMEKGFYRMRYKVDWNSIDAGGNISDDNSIISNGGAFVDVKLNVHAETSKVSIVNLNGQIFAGDSTLLPETVEFGKDLEVLMVPAPGFTSNGISIKHGYLDGQEEIHGVSQWTTTEIPSYNFKNNRYVIPAKYVDGDLVITGNFVSTEGETSDNDYSVNFDPKELTITRTDRRLESISLTVDSKKSTIQVPHTAPIKVFNNRTDSTIVVKPGSSITPSVSYKTGGPMHGYLYIDYNNDGKFLVNIVDNKPTAGSELVCYSRLNEYNSLGVKVNNDNLIPFPAFTLPEDLPNGVYRARLKIDWNNSDPGGIYGSAYSSNYIDANGGSIVDFLLNVDNGSTTLNLLTENGSIYGNDKSALPISVATGSQDVTFIPTPVLTGYELQTFTIKHGQNLDGPELIHGNRQWSTIDIPVTTASYTLPAAQVDGNVVVVAKFKNMSSDYKLAFSDEFNAVNGSGYDKSKWQSNPYRGSTWNRFVVDTLDVAFHKDGNMVLRCIPNTDKSTYDFDMMSGAIISLDKFGFKHGKFECRAKTNPFVGNFPAIWLLPTYRPEGWPASGEIDVFEQINTENIAYHTVHTNWTFKLGHKTNPSSSYHETVAQDRYHVYGLEKEDGILRWYVDGKLVGSYNRLDNNADALSKGQWPFEKDFYIILNQSVGDGSWASSPNKSHTYEMDVDWVRVYTKDVGTGLESIVSSNDENKNIYSLDGRLVVSNDKNAKLPKGFYLSKGKKMIVK